MWEIAAIWVGMAVGAAASWRGAAVRGWAIAVVAVVAGVTVSALSGELAESWAFALFDIAQVVVAASLTIVLVRRARGRQRA